MQTKTILYLTTKSERGIGNITLHNYSARLYVGESIELSRLIDFVDLTPHYKRKLKKQLARLRVCKITGVLHSCRDGVPSIDYFITEEF